MVDHAGKYQRIFPESVRKIHVLPRIYVNPETGMQDADTDYAYHASLENDIVTGRMKLNPRLSFIKPGPYALFLANVHYDKDDPKKVVHANMDYFGSGMREEDMQIEPFNGNLIVWVFDRLKAVKDNSLFYFYAIDHLPKNDKGELDVASLAKTITKQLQGQVTMSLNKTT